MTQKEYVAKFKAEVEKLIALTEAKNADYAEDNDALANFRFIAILTHGRVRMIDGILVRMCDKMRRIASLLSRPGRVKSESLADTFRDLSVYSLIGKMIVEESDDEVRTATSLSDCQHGNASRRNLRVVAKLGRRKSLAAHRRRSRRTANRAGR